MSQSRSWSKHSIRYVGQSAVNSPVWPVHCCVILSPARNLRVRSYTPSYLCRLCHLSLQYSPITHHGSLYSPLGYHRYGRYLDQVRRGEYPTTSAYDVIGIPAANTKDLLTNPALRNVADVAHKITAVGSRSVESAQKFIDRLKANPSPNQWGVDGTNEWGLQNGVLDDVKACGSYADVFSDPVRPNSRLAQVADGRTSTRSTSARRTPSTTRTPATPSSLASMCSARSRSPSTSRSSMSSSRSPTRRSSSSWSELVREAVLMLRAVWTRFHPIAYALQDLLKSGKLGAIKRMSADFSMNFAPDSE